MWMPWFILSLVSLGIVDMLRDYFYIEIYIKILIHRTREVRERLTISEESSLEIPKGHDVRSQV